MPWLRVAVPGAFVGYGVFLVAHSVIFGVVAGVVVSVVCWVVLRPIARERKRQGAQPQLPGFVACTYACGDAALHRHL